MELGTARRGRAVAFTGAVHGGSNANASSLASQPETVAGSMFFFWMAVIGPRASFSSSQIGQCAVLRAYGAARDPDVDCRTIAGDVATDGGVLVGDAVFMARRCRSILQIRASATQFDGDDRSAHSLAYSRCDHLGVASSRA